MEHVDRDAAARIPVAADAEPDRRHLRHEPFRDADRAVLVKGGLVPEGAEIKLQRLAFHEAAVGEVVRSEEHTSELQSLMRSSYAVFCLKKKKQQYIQAAD